MRKTDILLAYALVTQLLLLISLIVKIPCFRQFVGFVYLTFIPGFLILRLLLRNEIKNESFSELIIYSIGLSLSFIMFLGFLINNIFLFLNKYLDIKLEPFSECPLLFVTLILTFILWLFNYYKFPKIDCVPSLGFHTSYLWLLLLLVLSILSMYFINYYNENILTLFLIFIFSIIPIMVAFDILKEENYLFTLWIISISLLYMNSLLGDYIRCTDNICEFYYSNLVIKNGFWKPSVPVSINAMLGVVIVLPIYSLLCSANLIWVYKVIVPLISSFIPVGLYKAFRGVTNEKISFLSCFFFISMYEFYTWFGLTMKMVAAGFFLALLILILTDKKLNRFSKSILSTIFAFSLSVSHYGTSYIFMFCLIEAFIIYKIMKKKKVENNSNEAIILVPTFVIIYIVFTISWYIYNSSSVPYINLVNLGRDIVKSILEEYILPEHSYGYQIIKGNLPLYLQILKVLYIITTIFMTVGLIIVMFRFKFRFNDEYIALSIPFFLSGGSVFIGGLSGACTPDRLYQIISFFLAPFCIIGGTTIINCFKRILKVRVKKVDINGCIKILSIFFMIFLLFNTCFVAEVFWKYNIGPMISISKPRIIRNGSLEEKEYFNRVYVYAIDIDGAEWLHRFMNHNYYIYCGRNSPKIFTITDITDLTWERGSIKSNIHTLTNRTVIHRDSYIYLSKFNTKIGKIKVKGGAFPVFINITQVPKIDLSSKIYTNGGCEIYYYS